MSADELTSEEISALADAFPVGPPSLTLLRMARFPPAAIPVVGYANALEFWTAIADEVAKGVMPDGRRQILAAARRRFPYSTRFADPPARAADHDIPRAQGVQVGDGNVQVNVFGGQRPGLAVAPPEPLRVLVLGASPAGLPTVRADQEARRISDAVATDRIAVRYVAAAMATDLEHVRKFRPQVVHFICHGDNDRLAFNDPRGEWDLVNADVVADTLAFYRDSAGIRLRAIMLAACDGSTLAPFFTGVADTVIAHRGKLADPCGVAFAGQFYRLLNGAADAAAADQTDLGPAAIAALANEAAVLTVALSDACAPVKSGLIVLSSGG